MRPTLLLILSLSPLFQVMAQSMTYNHDASKMNQITIEETGSGSLTPSLYYSLLHNNYAKTAAAKNKLAMRTSTTAAAYMQIDDATTIDSAMIKRAEIEALNVADRSGGALDLAWLSEGNKITSKMSVFEDNINRILQYGGTSSQQNIWKERYNIFSTAIRATQEAYMPNAQRKKQYLAIYADIVRENEMLVCYLVHLSNSKVTAGLLNATYTRQNKNATIAISAFARWRDAGWSATKKKQLNTDDRTNTEPLAGPILMSDITDIINFNTKQ